jgi:hypothetical protein
MRLEGRNERRLDVATKSVARMDAEAATDGQGQDHALAPALVDVSLDEIAPGETQVRVRMDPDAIEDYAEAMQEGATFPPVVLFREGELYRIGDGYHRVAAAKKAGFPTIKAEVRKGAKREALLYACGANSRNSLRRTKADRRRAVETLLRDELWGKWSDREIAKHCQVSPTTVGTIRAALSNLDSADNRRTYRRDGQVRTMDTSRIGTREATPVPINGAPPSAARLRRWRASARMSPEAQEKHRWYYLTTGLSQIITEFRPWRRYQEVARGVDRGGACRGPSPAGPASGPDRPPRRRHRGGRDRPGGPRLRCEG